MEKPRRKTWAQNKNGKGKSKARTSTISVRNNDCKPVDNVKGGIGSDFSFSTVTLKHSRAFIRTVRDYPVVQLYDTNTKGKFTYHVSNSGNLKVSDPNRTAMIPALHQLEYIVDNMVKTNVLELKLANGSSEFYDYNGVIRLREILMCKIVKDVMVKGRKFLFDFDFQESLSFQSPVTQRSLEAFWTMVDQDAPVGRLTLNGKSIASASLCSLMSVESSLNEEVLDQISHILNKTSKSHRTVIANAKVVSENPALFICKIRQVLGEALENVNILLYTNVFEENKKYSEQPHHGPTHQHFVFGIYSLDENKLLYVDTMTKTISKFFLMTCGKLSKELNNEGVLLVHFGVNLEETASGHGYSREDCLYPYQRCTIVGGIAVIIGMCIFTLDRQLFEVMTGQLDCDDLADKISYLRDISLHSHFLRIVIINWIINGVIDLSQIYRKVRPCRGDSELRMKINVSETNLETDAREELSSSSLDIKTESTPSEPCLDSDSAEVVCKLKNNITLDKSVLGAKVKINNVDYSEGYNEMSSSKYSSLNINVKTREMKSLIHAGTCANNLQNVLEVTTCDGPFSILYDEINYMLTSPPVISFDKKKCAYCIDCILANGRKRYKFFKCSPDKGKDDDNVLREIQSFFTQDNFLEWLEDDARPSYKITSKVLFNNSLKSLAKSRKRDDDIDPEVMIELNECLTSHVARKVQQIARTKVKCFKNTASPIKSGKAVFSSCEDFTEDADVLPAPPMGDLPSNTNHGRSSSLNIIRVGSKHGRIPVHFGEVQHLLIGRPTIVFRKNKCHYSLECTFYNGITGYKNFRCNRVKGRDDLDTLKVINEFLKVENFTPWLKENLRLKYKNKFKRDSKDKGPQKSRKTASRNIDGYKEMDSGGEAILVVGGDNSRDMDEGTEQICMEISDTGMINNYITPHPDDFESNSHHTPSTLNYDRIKEFIVGRPRVHFRRAKNMYRVECLLWNGNKVHRNFSCKTKSETLGEIQNFLRSDKAVNWVQNYDESWIFQYEVKAGIETRNCLDKIPFDITKHFIYDKKIVKPEYSKETCWVSVTENTKWGKTHRYDETYRIIGSSAKYDPNTVVAYVYLNCGSKTTECRSACGALLGSLTFHDNICDNCGTSLDTGRECSHCKTTTSSQWYYKGEPRELCATCYTYRQRKGCDRPVEFKVKGSRNPRKIHHEHLQCQWRMKLEMKLNSLNTWSVYESSENINYHVSLPVQENKKPALGIRDMWDKLRVSQKATSLQIHTIESQNKTAPTSKDELSNQIAHPLSQIKARCELVDKHHTGKSTTSEPYQMILDEEHHVDNDGLIVQVHQKEKQPNKKLRIESESNHTRICGICFEEGINPPFTCSTKRELDGHKNKVHNNYGDLCAICYKEMGMVVRFEDSKGLMQHLNKHKVKYH